MKTSVTMKIGENVYAATFISAKNTLELSRINRDQAKLIKLSEKVKNESLQYQKEIEAIKESSKGMEDADYINNMVSASEKLIESANEISEQMDDILIRKTAVICRTYNNKFDENTLLDAKTKGEIDEEFINLYNFANGIIRKN